MRLYPTSHAVHLAGAGLCVSVAGLASGEATIVGFGGALLVGLGLAQAVTRVDVAGIRAAGFEMVWSNPERRLRVGRGETVEIEAEVQSRDARAARFAGLSVLASPELEVDATPREGEVPAGGRLRVTLRVRGLRVGRHAIHGLSLEVRGAPGLFEVPLAFASPLGVEVLPLSAAIALRSPRGGRAHVVAPSGRSAPLPGDGYELRELRELRAGDPLKRVAWKASARRGKLLVREQEREERDVVWLALDASVELWAGAPGEAPLDHALDQVVAVARAHLERGDPVGLVVAGAEELARLAPERGPLQLARLVDALVTSTATLGADRSGLLPEEVAARVAGHLRTLAPGAAARVSSRDPSGLALVAAGQLPRAPHAPGAPRGEDPVDRALRAYLAAFGLGSPARLEPDRPRTDRVLGAALAELATLRPRPSRIYVWTPAPDAVRRPELLDALRARGRRTAEITFLRLHLGTGADPTSRPAARAARAAVALRAEASEAAGERALRHLGVRVERLRTRDFRGAPPPREAPPSGAPPGRRTP